MNMLPLVSTLKIKNSKDETLLAQYSKECSKFRLEKIKNYLKLEDKIRGAAVGLLLNQLVKEYTGNPIKNSLNESADDLGRPVLLDDPEICVSVSHSGGEDISYVSCALYHLPVGIDIEKKSDLAKVSLDSVFHQNEFKSDISRCWTSKEAYLKARGIGLALDPKNIWIESDEIKQDWNFRHLELDSDFYLSICWQKEISK